jgi:hypothetical protein
MSGPERIVKTPSGDWCTECHMDAKDPVDRDYDLYVTARVPNGQCQCCGARIENGEFA